MSSEPESCGDDLGIEGEEIVCETSVKSEDEEDEDTQSETFSVEGHRPVRPVERQKMRPWLIDLLDKNILPGLSWQNKKENIFRISWKHAAHNCFNRNRDSDLFERWAIHTGRHHEGNHKRWKANFRCALNSLPDVMELKELGVRKGDNAFKVYKFLDSPEPSLKEKMEIKKKYSLMAGIKLEDLSQSESSTPTASTAPSSPDTESSVGVDGGIQTLLKAIELKTLHAQQGAVKDSSKTPQKRASSGGTTQTRSKRKKESKDEETLVLVQTESSSGRPSPASTPGSSDRSTISAISPEEAKQLKYPFVGSLDPKTKRVTLVQLKKTDTSLPSTPTRGTPTGEIPVSKMLVNFPGITVSDSQNVLSSLRLGEQYITLPAASESPIQEQKITIPIQLLQQELLQKQPLSPGMVSIQSLLAGNSAASVQIAKQLESLMNPTIPIPVMEKINQAKNKDKQQKEMNPAEKQMPKIILQTDQQHVRMVATAPVTENLPTPQLNRHITSIAAALRMSTPVSLPVSSTVVTSTFIQPSQSVTTSIPAAGLAQDPQGIRSKLVSRLMVSGSSMTSTTPNVRMPTGIQMATIIAPPRPRLDHLLVKPNPSLTLPRTQLQPVKPNDIVVMATATSSNVDLMSSSGPPLLMPGHERTIDLNANKNISSSVSTTQTKRTKEADVISLVSIGSGYSSPVCTPELRPDILDRQVTIELGKIEKDIMTSKSAEDTQHLSDKSSCSKRTVQTQCNMLLWKYFNGKLEESPSSSSLLSLLPATRKTTWTQCSFVDSDTSQQNTGSCLLGAGEITETRTTIIKQALSVLRSSQYKMLHFKVIKMRHKKRKAIIITNKQYFNVLGHNLEPLTLTLTSNGRVALNIIFRPVEEFSLLKQDKSFQVGQFKEILDKITHHSFCSGIKKSFSRRKGVTFLHYPFRRYQSDNCLLWFQAGKDLLVTQCSHCKLVSRSLNGKCTQTDIDISDKVTIKDIFQSEKIAIKETEKVVVEKMELIDTCTVLECMPQLPP